MLVDMFPRNPDGTIKHKQGCRTEGCNWPNWHICLDKSDPGHYTPHGVKKPRKLGSMSEEQRRKISEARIAGNAARRALTKERDDLIIKHYTEGKMGMSHISSSMGIAQSTVNKVLNRAQREGVLKIRPKNFTLNRPGR